VRHACQHPAVEANKQRGAGANEAAIRDVNEGIERGQCPPHQRHRLRDSRIRLVQSFATAHLDSFGYPDGVDVIRRKLQH